MNRWLKNLVVWILVVGAILLFYKFYQAPSAEPVLMDSRAFAEAVQTGRVTRVRLPQGVTVGGTLSEKGPDGKPVPFVIAASGYRDLVDDLLRQKVAVEFYSPRESSLQVTFLSWLPMLVLIGIWFYFLRKIQNARRQADGQPGFGSGAG